MDAEKHDIHLTKKAKSPGVNGTDASNSTEVAACGSCYGAEDKEGDCCNTCEEVGGDWRVEQKLWHAA